MKHNNLTLRDTQEKEPIHEKKHMNLKNQIQVMEQQKHAYRYKTDKSKIVILL